MTMVTRQQYSIPPAQAWVEPVILEPSEDGSLTFFGETGLSAPTPLAPLIPASFGLFRDWHFGLDRWKRSLDEANGLRREGRYEEAQNLLVEIRKGLFAEHQRLGSGADYPLLRLWDEGLTPLEEKVHYSWKKLEYEAGRLEVQIGLADLKKVPAFKNRLQKVREGIERLARMDRELPLKSLAHGEWREDFRRRLIEFYLSPSDQGREELEREWELLAGLQVREGAQAYLFEQLTQAVPTQSIFFGSPGATSEAERDLNGRAQELWGPDYSRPSRLEIPRAEMESGAFFSRLKVIREQDPAQAAAIERALTVLMMGDTFKRNVFRLRSPAPRLGQNLENGFRVPLPEDASLPEIEAWWKQQANDLKALKTFLEEVAHQEEMSGIAQNPSSRIQFVVQAGKQRAFLYQSQAWGMPTKLDLVKRDLLRQTEVLREVEKEKLLALREEFLSKQPEGIRKNFQEEGAWEQFGKIEKEPLWLQVLSPAYEMDWKRSVRSFLPDANFHFDPACPPALWIGSDPAWQAILRQEARLEAFEKEEALIEKGIAGARTLVEALEAGRPLEDRLNASLLDAVNTLKNQIQIVAKGGNDSLPEKFREKVALLQTRADEISEMAGGEARDRLAMDWLAQVQTFVLGINLDREIEMMRALKEADLRWGALKNTAWHFLPWVTTEDYASVTQENFEAHYLQHLLKAKALYGRGKYQEAMTAFNALQGSPQRRRNIERGASSARWSGLSIGIGIVAVSALTAGAATEVLLPVGIQGVGLALGAARFVANASVFWAADRFLNSQVYGQPFLGKGPTPAGRAGEVFESYLENLLMFGFLSGAGKAYQGLLFQVLTPRAERLAIQLGQEVAPGVKLGPGDFSRLPAEVQSRLVRQTFQNLGRKGRAAVALGANVNTWLSLNLWSAITQADYDMFSWKTQEDLVIFLAGLKLAHPLMEGVQRHMGMRKIRDAQKIISEVEANDRDALAWAEAMGRYQEKQVGSPAELLRSLKDWHLRRMGLMKKLPTLFPEEVQAEAQRDYVALDWELRKTEIFWRQKNAATGKGATYSPARAAQLVKGLAEILGTDSALRPQVFLEVHDNGVIEIRLHVDMGEQILLMPAQYIAPERKMGPREIATLRQGIPPANRFAAMVGDLPVASDAGPARPPVNPDPKLWN